MKKILVILILTLTSLVVKANDTIPNKVYSMAISKQTMLDALSNAYKFAYFQDLEDYMTEDILFVMEFDSLRIDEFFESKNRISVSLTNFYRQIDYDEYEIYSRQLESCNYEYLVICYVYDIDKLAPVSLLFKTNSMGLIYYLVLK